MLRHRVLLMMIPLTVMSCSGKKSGGGSGGGSGSAKPMGVSLDTISEGGKVRGFTAVSLYLDDADKPLGARFVHDATGFTFDYLRIETAPQGFIWVNSFPTSD